ncbi:Hypothetical protein A7982_02727 [Minicystis rosea]|nr:Hypothetical protein A7982_02727 [Minicystis rosea]
MPTAPSEIAPGVHRFERVDDSGWSFNMFVVRGLEPDGVVVHAPTFVDDATFDAIEAIGPVRALLCPNHFHWLAVRRFRERFPEARVVADARAVPRLTRKLGFAPEAATWPAWRSPAGLKNGEGWLSLPSPDGPTWIACDAFFNIERPVRGAIGAMLRWSKTVPHLCIGRTFHWLAISDRAAYRSWLLARLDEERPHRLLVSHGEPIEGAALADRLRAVVADRLA